MNSFKWFKEYYVTIQRSLTQHMILLILLASGAIFATSYFYGSRIAITHFSQSHIKSSLDQTEAELNQLFDSVKRNLFVARDWAQEGLLDHSDPKALNLLLIPLLKENPNVSSILFADVKGIEYLLLRADKLWKNRLTNIPERGQRTQWMSWKDAQTLLDKWEKVLDYDPRKRPWFKGALTLTDENEIYWTEPYTFFTTQEPGITASTIVGDADIQYVVAYDVLLLDISKFTTQFAISKHGMAFVTTEDGKVIGLPKSERFVTDTQIKQKVFTSYQSLGIMPLKNLFEAQQKLLPAEKVKPFHFTSEDVSWWGGSRVFTVGNLRLLIGVAMPEKDILPWLYKQRIIILFIIVVTIVLAIFLARYVARNYSRPLEILAQEARRIRDLDLDKDMAHINTRIVEVKELVDTQAQMLSALQSFSKYVPLEVVKQLVKKGEVAKIGGTTEELTVLFTDIQGFTSIAEQMSPEGITSLMEEYFESMIEVLRKHNATIDKFIGDAIVAFWGAPLPDIHHAQHAVCAVLNCLKELEANNVRWVQKGLPALPTRFGLATGSMTVGNVGARSRLSYTVLGDTVNLSSRIEGLNRFYGTGALAAETVKNKTGEEYVWRLVDTVNVKGKKNAVKIYEPIGRSGDVSEERIVSVKKYEEALRMYSDKKFKKASVVLEELINKTPSDSATKRLLHLCRQYLTNPPDDSWSGITQYKDK
ncbi:MAG: adenylate/guanylate cyclase domain-containing protein [Candidatus Ancaeobacter aquaticus]|nr:adenylate/guanylate cyclase domain-containing protein [Candidatus Ancaeobacter aquaticus]